MILQLLFSAGCAVAAALAPQPETHYALIDDFAYGGDAAARKAWAPMKGSADVSVVRAGNRAALRMPCDFSRPDVQRASWDRAGNLDLALSRGIQFQFYCADPKPVGRFSIYLRSGNGWYVGGFAADPKGWKTITVEKAATWTEGAPEGWGAISVIRISAWRAGDQNTEFYVAGLGAIPSNSPIVVVRGEFAARQTPAELKGIEAAAETAIESLKSMGIESLVVSDLDVTEGRLEGKKAVILPYNPSVPEALVAALEGFVKKGGKIVSFYSLPSSLAAIEGIQPGRHVPQERPGYFASIRGTGKLLPGMPPIVSQRSWNIGEAKPIEGRSQVVASWFDDQGAPTGQAAILVSDCAVHMTHVLLPEDPENKRRLLLAMLGHLVPSVWRQSAEWHIAGIGVLGPYADFNAAKLAIAAAHREEALLAMDKASDLRSRAKESALRGAFADAIAAAGDANACVLRAYCAIQQPEPGEHRAWWCHDAFGVSGMDWDQAIRNLADNGFTAVFPNMLWGGTAYYASKVLPVAPEVAQKGDQVALCAAACKKYGIECHVWKVNWNTGGRATPDFLARIKREGRTQVKFDGSAQDQWLCPSHPANQQLEIDAMVEVAADYDVDGIHFDYIRYPDSDACFCAGCRSRFEKAIGAKVRNWPGDVRSDKALEQKWLEFRRDQITRVVAAVSEKVRKAKPRVKISAAVFRNWPSDRDTVAQDWKLWCDKGYVDFVCPMDYTPLNAEFENMIAQQLAWAGKTPCYPGIGLSVWPNPTDVSKLIDQVAITRRLGTGGFTIFNYGLPQATEVAPACGLGLTRRN